MKKTTKIVIGTLLVVAVGYLLYRQFSGGGKARASTTVPKGDHAQGVGKWEGDVWIGGTPGQDTPSDVVIK